MKLRYLEKAKEVAMLGEGTGKGRFKVGAVLVHKRRGIISARHNSLKTHPFLLQFTSYPYLHAEAAAILAVGMERAEDCELYVVRVNKLGQMALAKPCNICQSLIDMAHITNTFYSINEGEVGIL